jgi:hypothetical protein
MVLETSSSSSTPLSDVATIFYLTAIGSSSSSTSFSTYLSWVSAIEGVKSVETTTSFPDSLTSSSS